MVSRTLRPRFTPGKDPVPILQEALWAPGPVWKGGKSRPHWGSIRDRPARSQSLYQLSYRAHFSYLSKLNYRSCCIILVFQIEKPKKIKVVEDCVSQTKQIAVKFTVNIYTYIYICVCVCVYSLSLRLIFVLVDF